MTNFDAINGAFDVINGETPSAQPTVVSAHSFDMDTAWLRRAETDRSGFVARFAMILAEALPHHSTVHKVKKGLFKKTEEIVGVSVTFDTETFELNLVNAHALSTVVQKKVRGIVLNTREVDPHLWMKDLMARVHERTEQARALSDLLGRI